MDNKKTRFHNGKVFKILAIFFTTCIVLVFVGKAAGYFLMVAANKQALKQAEGADDIPSPAAMAEKTINDVLDKHMPPQKALQILIRAGIQGNHEKWYNPLSDGYPLLDAAQLFVAQNSDVIHSDIIIDKGRWSWSVFGGWGEPYWHESIEWCMRLKYLPGDEEKFTQTLLQIAQMPFSEFLGLTNSSVDAVAMNNLLIPFTTYRYGSSSTQTVVRTWSLQPQSTLCKKLAL